MKIDYDYVNKIFEVFLNSDTPTVDWEDFGELHNHNHKNNDSNFIFHISHLVDGKFISN